MGHKTKEARSTWYKEHPEQRERSRQRRRLGREQKLEYIRTKKNHPCMDCGGKFPPICMDFDHVRGIKLLNLSKASDDNWAKAKIDAEIAKCDVVCANCHRIRTWARAEGSRVALQATLLGSLPSGSTNFDPQSANR